MGSSAVFKTSDSNRVDLYGKRLGNYCIIFGKVLSWEEIQWHITECRRLGIIERAFANLRQFGFITIRANSKNSKIPPPTPLDYFHNGDSTGITKFIKHWKMCRNMGRCSL